MTDDEQSDNEQHRSFEDLGDIMDDDSEGAGGFEDLDDVECQDRDFDEQTEWDDPPEDIDEEELETEVEELEDEDLWDELGDDDGE